MRFVLLYSLLFLYTSSFSQDSTRLSLFEKLYADENVQITLTYHFDSLYKSNNNEIEASIDVVTGSGILMDNVPMTLNLRGKFRRMKCIMPPLLLNFKKSTLKELKLKSVDELKLVTHCLEGPEGPQNLAEERIIYQLYEAITPLSYRTIWVNVKYCNTAKPGECIESVGFLLEPDKVISDRLSMDEKKMFNMAQDSIDFGSYANAAAFNFLIGNRDWSIIASRNAKLFYHPASGKYIVIPYDFDYSNIVGATYRRETLPEKMIHPFDRIYEGEYFIDHAGAILKKFYDYRQTILDVLYSANNPMNKERRVQIADYFENWFDMVKRKKEKELQFGVICPYKGGL